LHARTLYTYSGRMRKSSMLSREGGRVVRTLRFSRSVALQVEFERQTLKPVFHVIGNRLWV
jgi:hypothetical protein